MTGKPTVADLGIDPGTQHWQRSGLGPGAIEVAFVRAPAHSPGLGGTVRDGTVRDETVRDDAVQDGAVGDGAVGGGADPNGTDLDEWVLMRVAGDPEGRILVFDRHEWECFLDGARKGEFDDATSADTASTAAP